MRNSHRCIFGPGVQLHRAALLLCIAGLAASASAQNAPPSDATVLHISSRLVVLDVVVTGRDGKAVPGLTKDDFTVLEDGQPQTIRSFAYTSSPSDPASHSRSVLVLDTLNVPLEESAYAKTELEHYISTLPEILLQPAMLVTVNDRGLSVLISSTRDRSALEHALHALHAEIPSNLMRHDNEARFRLTLGALLQIAQATDGAAGRTELIWVGHGCPGVNLTAADPAIAHSMQALVQGVSDALLSSRIVLYKIDPAPVGSAQMTPSLDNFDAAIDDSVEPFADTINFDTIVQQTGGSSFFNRNDLDTEVSQAVNLGGSFYTLTYRPAYTETDVATYHHLRVVVARPETHASTRLGYYSGAASTAQTSAVDPNKIVDTAIVSSLQYRALAVQAGGCTRSGPAVDDATCKLTVPTSTLQWTYAADGSRTAHLLIGAAAYSAAGKPLSYTHHGITLHLRADQPSQSSATMDVPMHIASPAKKLRFIVLDTDSGKLGSAELMNPALAPSR